MLAALTGLSRMRPHYTDDTRDLFHVLLTSTSAVEANIALDLLSRSVPEKPLVSALNLREAIKSIPPTPFRMSVDESTLVRVGNLEKDLACYRRETSDGYFVLITTAGNLVLDLIVKDEREKWFWTPVPATDDFVDPDLIGHIVDSDLLFETVVEIIKAMGMVYNPTLYISLDDWRMEHARAVIEEYDGLF